MPKRWVLFSGWIVVIAVATLSFGSSGARYSFSALYKPMIEQFGWDRAALAGAASLNLLLSGLLRPLVGWMVDKYGAKSIAIWGVATSALGLGLLSFITELWQAYVLFCFLAIGYAAGPVTTIKIVGSWFVRRRALALSVASTGTSLGELIIAPLALWLLLMSSWQVSFRMLSIMFFVIMLPVGLIFLKNNPKDKGTYPDGDLPGSAAEVASTKAQARIRNASLGEALRSPTFWKLAVGFFVCGLTMSFANTHLLAFADDMGFEPMVAATALIIMGFFSILGSLSLGYLSDTLGRRNMLAVVYFLRGTAFVILLSVSGPWTLYAAAFVLGISWTSTGPLTSAISADLWGLTSIGVIYGSMFTVMPIGSAIGATFDAWIFDTHHNYQLALWVNVFAGLIAGLSVLSIREKGLTKKKVPVTAGAAASDGTER